MEREYAARGSAFLRGALGPGGDDRRRRDATPRAYAIPFPVLLDRRHLARQTGATRTLEVAVVSPPAPSSTGGG